MNESPHLLYLDRHHFPVLDVHVAVPHWQSTKFLVNPSVLEQGAGVFEHVLVEQYIPEDASQVLAPHLHSMALRDVASVFAQVETSLHELDEDLHNLPLAQFCVPQVQATEFTAVWSLLVQSGFAPQKLRDLKQYCPLEQDALPHVH